MVKVAVCDDEPLMRKDLSSGISYYMEEKELDYQIHHFVSGGELLDSDEMADILFLDIQMKEPDGVETARQLRERGFQGLLIFITVLKERVFEAFEVQAYDYLVKPLENERLRRTMDRAIRSLERETEKKLVVQNGGACRVIPYAEIMYGEVYGHKIYLHCQGGEVIEYYDRLDHLEGHVDQRFFRCHRSYLVNLDYVRGYSEGLVKLSDGGKIPVSRLRERELADVLLLHMKERRR